MMLYEQAPQTGNLRKAVSHTEGHTLVKGLTGSSFSFAFGAIFQDLQHHLLLVLNDKEEAAYYFNDFEKLFPDQPVLFYPGSYRRPYEIDQTNNANVLLRAEVLNGIRSTKKAVVVVTYPDALFEKVVTRKQLKQHTLKLKQGDKVSLERFNESLFEFGFKRVDFVTDPGEFSVRGGIVDLYSYAHELPLRIEFFGDEIDSIRTFDVATQLSISRINRISILPNVETTLPQENRIGFLEFLPAGSTVYLKHPELVAGQLDHLFEKAQSTFKNIDSPIARSRPDDLFVDGKTFIKQLSSFNLITSHWNLNGNPGIPEPPASEIGYRTQPQPPVNKNFDLLISKLVQNREKGFQNYIFCASQDQAQRFHDIFEEVEQEIHYQTIVLPLYRGFEDADLRIACYTDHEIFERYHKFYLKNSFSKKQAISLREINKLEIGDYVTHIDHGIGKYGGLKKIDVNGKKQEAIKLLYGERDILYVSIHSLHKISKYSGKDGATPKIYKLGSAAWKKLKQKTKSRVKKIAYDLISVYAKRKLKKGFSYAPDSYLQHELEASFLYEDTPDQVTATRDVKRDMESESPMDRLICGDVGFGKTEIAIRAAFKAVDNGKQVAVLVPTTILAFQHYRTFTERLREMPVEVDYLNRFRSAAEKKNIISRLAEGKLDILIGTHQLASDKVKFKDLGLLIVDEEQKFGVGVKDKLKALKTNVDVLTLTATPIPRTLQFSLMAARDLSVINTPPPNRYPIDSRVIRLDEEVIRDAIMYEIQRGGQVFFIHNRIQNIKEVAGMVQRLVPDARVRVGHGQMEGRKLESLMLDFMNGGFDVLVSTTIVESGLDVSNANTIFINYANQFGLSDLHQMRGRVGRSNKKAFCYFITPPYEAMTPEARKRIAALEQFTELGSGFNIAMKDLEIRGAGDLLGPEQSGFINDVGFQAYQDILNEAIVELKEDEFKSLFKDEPKKAFVQDPQIDAEAELLIPDDYINSVSERMQLYTELNTISDEDALLQFTLKLTDRFGALPAEVKDLLNSVRLKWHAKSLGLEKLILKKGRLIGYFVSDQDSAFYRSPQFTAILQFAKDNPKTARLKEKQTAKGLRLLINFDGIRTVDQAIAALKPLLVQPESVTAG